jgi:hypothetical protein
MDVQQYGKREQQISAESHKGLLSDGHQSGVSGQQVPQARQGDERKYLGEQSERLAIAPIRRESQNDDGRADDHDADAAGAGGVLYVAHPDTLGKRPCGRTARMARNTM